MVGTLVRVMPKIAAQLWPLGRIFGFASGSRRLRRGALVAAILASLAGDASASLWPDAPDKLKADLASPDISRRRAAAVALADVPKDELLPLLAVAVNDPDIDVRLAAADAAGARGVADVADAITTWLTDPEPRLRVGACDYFARVPQPRVVKILARALGDTVTAVRLSAVRALGNAQSNEAVAPLLARLDDGDSKVRLAVASALGRLGDTRAVTPLVSKVQDEASEVRQAVMRALGELGDPRAAPALVIALKDSVVEVRIEALAALGRLKADEAVPSIAPLTVDVSKKPGTADVRRAALAALGRIGSVAAVEAIVRAFGAYEDANADVGSSPAREAAVSAGANAGKVLLERLRDGLLAPNAATITAAGGTPTLANVSASAAYVLGELHTDGAGDVIVKAMRRGDVPPPVALHALASLGDESQLPTCLEYVASSDKPARAQALIAAARLLDPEKPDGRAVEPLLASLELAQTPEDRAEIATLLGRTGAERASTTLIGLTAAKDDVLRLAAIDALGTLGAAKGGPTLVKLLGDPSGVVRLHAAIAIGRSAGADVLGDVEKLLTQAAEADRLALVIAIGGLLERVGDANAVAWAADALKAGVAAERDLLVVALGRAKDPSATKALSTLLAQSIVDVDARRAIAVALGARVGDGAAATQLRALAADADPTVRAQVAWSLGAVGDASDVALLSKLAKDGALPVAANAVAALGRIGARTPSDAPPPALCAALDDDRAYVRADAMGALLQRARGGHAAICGDGAVERKLLADDPNEVVRTFAARLMGATQAVSGASPPRSALERCVLADPSGAVASVCREMLRPMGGANAASASTAARALVVFVSPEDGGAPTPRGAYALERPEGLLHLGAADRRGAVVELLLPRGTVRLRVAVPGAGSAS